MAGTSIEQKRAIVRALASEYGVEFMCELIEMERSTYYYRIETADDQAARAAILDVAGRFSRYAYPRVYAQLKREHCEAVESASGRCAV